MKFYCDKNEISSVTAQVGKALSSKAAIPVFEGIYIEVKGDTCTMLCSNGQLSIESSFKADVKEEGIALVPGRIFSDIIRKCYDGEIEITCGSAMTIVSGKSKASIGLMDYMDYPKVELEDEKWSFKIDNIDLKDMIKGSIFCIAGENSPKPVLTGVYVESDGDALSFVSIDGCRMAIKKLQGNFGQGKFVIPGKALEEIGRTIGDEGDIEFVVYEKYLKVMWNDISIVSTLFNEKEYVNFKDILPKEHTVRIKVNVKALHSSIEMGSILSRVKQNNLLVLTIDKDLLTITARSDIGELYDEIDIWQEGDHLKIGFNGNFLSDCFKAISDEFVYIEFNSDRSPCIIKPISSDSFLYMILPIQIS